MCNPLSAGLSSLVNSLPHSSGATQKIVLQLTYNVSILRLPKWTDNFEEALISCSIFMSMKAQLKIPIRNLAINKVQTSKI